MSVHKNKSLRSLAESISYAIDKGKINQALILIHNFVEGIITEPLCTSHVYGSETLDNLCQKIGRLNFSMINGDDHLVSTDDRVVFVYIVTKLQKSGGHTKVIEDFIKARPDARHLILSTELYGNSDTDYLGNGLVRRANVKFEAAPGGNYQCRLAWLQRRLIKVGPRRVYLFNHHQDCVAVAAIQPEMGLDTYFYHHGDHHLCLGVYLSHIKHIDPHPMGYHNCRDVLGIDNILIPLIVDDKGRRPNEWVFKESGYLTTCTAARSNKIEIPYFVSYLEVIPAMLKVTGGKHIHIGRLTPWALFKIRSELKRHGVPLDRFVYTPWVPSVWKALHEFRVDLYIASFPYGGGLTLIETMGAGIPVALHKHIFSRVLSGIDMAYAEVFCWRAPDELIAYCANVSPEVLREHGNLGREHYEKFHRKELLEEILLGGGKVLVSPTPLKDFIPEFDEWACWMERQPTFRHIILRGVYRLFRRFRSGLWFA